LQKQEVKKESRKEPMSLLRIAWTVLAALTFLILLMFSIPWAIFIWLDFNARHTKATRQKAYWSYIAATYYLNQLGFSRERMSPAEFAKEKIDPEFNTDLTSFMHIYLKSKYSNEALTGPEQMIAEKFYHQFYKTLKEKISFKERFLKFLNFYRTINFFSKPKI